MEQSPIESPEASLETTLALEESSSLSPAPSPTEDAATYMEAEWAGLPQYLCTACGHQTWDLETMQGHQERMHEGRMQPLRGERPTVPGSESGAGTPEAGGVGTAAGAEAAETEAAGQESEAPAATATSPAPEDR